MTKASPKPILNDSIIAAGTITSKKPTKMTGECLKLFLLKGLNSYAARHVVAVQRERYHKDNSYYRKTLVLSFALEYHDCEDKATNTKFWALRGTC